MEYIINHPYKNRRYNKAEDYNIDSIVVGMKNISQSIEDFNAHTKNYLHDVPFF